MANNPPLKVDLAVQEFSFSDDYRPFTTPFRMLVCGSSNCGKSTWILKVIENREKMFDTKFVKILFCVPSISSSLHQQMYHKMKDLFRNTTLIYDLPKATDISNDTLPKLIILDDLFDEIVNSPYMDTLFTKISHHLNASILLTCQDYFSRSRSKTIMRNIDIKILFYPKLDLQYLRYISLQIKPTDSNFLYSIFQTLNDMYPSDNYKYICINGTQSQYSEICKVTTRLFPNDEGIIEPLIFF